ncbi:MAG: glycosyltransferase 87 family protein [Candidatus Nanopelagicaceae bacterium]
MLRDQVKPVALAGLVGLISLVKSDHCRDNGFASPDNYTHLCYSDIPALFGSRGLDQGINPYQDPANAMEYPVGTGYIASTFARFSDSYLEFFDLNALALIALFIGTTLLLRKICPKFWYLFPLAPAAVSSLFINWDLWAILPMVLGFFSLQRERFDFAGFYIGLAIAVKFFPIFLLPAFAIYFLVRRRREWISFFAYLLVTWLALNFTTAIMHFDGWSRFFTFNQERGVDLGSLWYAASLLGFDLAELISPNLATLLLILGATALAWKVLRDRLDRSTYLDSERAFQLLTLLSFLSLALLFSINKVYSPQYVLWLTPLALMAMDSSGEKDSRIEGWSSGRIWFWIWQVGEAVYHLAIWQYLVEYSGGKGLSSTLYALTILIRIATLGIFAHQLSRARLSLPSRGSG